jgi:hypothetical protein
MIIFRPIKSNYKTQSFGDNKPCAQLDANGKTIRPYIIEGNKINGVCPAGWTDFYSSLGMKGHNGDDWYTWHGEPLYFPVDLPEAGGWWAKDASDLDGGLGVDVISKNEVTLNGQKSHIKFRFWHLKKSWKDNSVEFGELIGYCDNTGASSGDHLHWNMKRCHSNGSGIHYSNGYYGAEDFSKWFENTYVLDEIKRRNAVTETKIEIKEAQLTLIDRLRQLISALKAEIQKLSTPPKS